MVCSPEVADATVLPSTNSCKPVAVLTSTSLPEVCIPLGPGLLRSAGPSDTTISACGFFLSLNARVCPLAVKQAKAPPELESETKSSNSSPSTSILVTDVELVDGAVGGGGGGGGGGGSGGGGGGGGSLLNDRS
jgi:Predicted membrane protein